MNLVLLPGDNQVLLFLLVLLMLFWWWVGWVRTTGLIWPDSRQQVMRLTVCMRQLILWRLSRKLKPFLLVMSYFLFFLCPPSLCKYAFMCLLFLFCWLFCYFSCALKHSWYEFLSHIHRRGQHIPSSQEPLWQQTGDWDQETCFWCEIYLHFRICLTNEGD